MPISDANKYYQGLEQLKQNLMLIPRFIGRENREVSAFNIKRHSQYLDYKISKQNLTIPSFTGIDEVGESEFNTK